MRKTKEASSEMGNVKAAGNIFSMGTYDEFWSRCGHTLSPYVSLLCVTLTFTVVP